MNEIYYTSSAHFLEAIDVIEAFVYGLEGVEASDTANVLKYVLRWKWKNGLEDLKKARWYIDHLIRYLEKKEAANGKCD